MANTIQLNPKKCANFPGENWGCGVRWEILGNSRGLWNILQNSYQIVLRMLT